MRPINDDVLKESTRRKMLYSEWQKLLIEKAVNDQSTVDAVPVGHSIHIGSCCDRSADGCPVYYEMLNEIQYWRERCRNYERTIYKLSVALTERAERELHDTAS